MNKLIQNLGYDLQIYFTIAFDDIYSLGYCTQD